LAADIVPLQDHRLENLVRAQHEVMSLVLEGADPKEVLRRSASAIEQAFAPGRAVISLAGHGDDGWKHHAGPGVPAELLSLIGTDVHAQLTPTAASVLNGKRTIVTDLGRDQQWPDHAKLAVAHGLKSCWVEPIPDHADGLFGAATLYYPDAREPSSGDEHILAVLKSFIGLAVIGAERACAFRVANERFAALVSAIPGVVYQRVVKPDGDIYYSYISEGARELFGASPEEILANPEVLFKTHGPEYKAKFRERLLAASRTLSVWDVEATLVTPDGRKKYTHAIAHPARLEDGSVLWTGVILDETRTREAILDSLSQGFLLFDPQDRLVMRNSHYLTLFPTLLDVAVPGATYPEVTRAEALPGSSPATENTDDSAELRERIKRHKKAHHVFERQLEDDRWILVNEHRTGDGGTVIFYTDVSELKRREKQIRHLAFHDVLTGLPNRALFNQRIERALARARRRGSGAVVMCIDVDHFKSVNDSLGHSAGDQLLKCLSARLRSTLRATDTIARLGGDEFGIVATAPDAPDFATQLACRLLAVANEPLECNGHQIVTGISIGIATSASDGRRPEELLKNADLALYRAKGDGRGTFRFFEAEMDARAQARRALEIELRQALARQEFELHYQPQIDIERGEVIGFEALVRWRNSQRGLVPPLEFIPVAEQNGMITRLGEWVLRRACEDAVTWPGVMTVAVNVSPAQFRNRDLAHLVERILKETGLEPRRLEVEITESLLLRDIAANLATLNQLKALGVRISMDDFGTGYSSLANLRSFPFDKIKIDRSFVSDLEKNSDSAAIVKAILGLGRSLGMVTCAEGVETEEQLVCLRGEGCTLVQGYYYGKPRPICDIVEFLDGPVP
jgi:diguanylate cyclase (GGDEF)-like protein